MDKIRLQSSTNIYYSKKAFEKLINCRCSFFPDKGTQHATKLALARNILSVSEKPDHFSFSSGEKTLLRNTVGVYTI